MIMPHIDGANGLENMGKGRFKDEVQIVDFYHAMDHASEVLQTLLGNILAFRCINASRRLEAFWKYRSNQHTARNDVLSLAS